MMVSPPLHEGLDVPCDQFDEWYIFEDAGSRIREFDRFVNYGSFNLADPSFVCLLAAISALRERQKSCVADAWCWTVTKS